MNRFKCVRIPTWNLAMLDSQKFAGIREQHFPMILFYSCCLLSRLRYRDYPQCTRLTDGRTDARSEFPSQDRVCIPCSALRTIYLITN